MGNCDKLIEIVERISGELKKYHELIDIEYFEPFQSDAEGLQETVVKIMEEGRDLRIGIIGSVKAGKSTFLNALAFDGKEVLPKAATPMTAALTKISYSETPQICVIFYTREDWAKIETLSNKYYSDLNRLINEEINNELQVYNSNVSFDGAPPFDMASIKERATESVKYQLSGTDMAGCAELVDMARERRTNIMANLGNRKMVPVESIQDYVGSGGTYSPIVKYIEAKFCFPELKGLEIVDTPGLNDPVISRTIQTQKFLKECDVVFLLCRGAQFLTSTDMKLLQETLPGEGVRDAYLISTQFDSAIQSTLKKWNNKSFNEVANSVFTELDKRAISELSTKGNSKETSEVIERMRNQPRYFTSAIMYVISTKKKNGITLTAEEKSVLTQFQGLRGFKTDDPNFLRDFSGIDDVRNEALAKVRKEKDLIIRKRKENLFSDQQSKFLNHLENIRIAAANGRRQLQNAEIAQLDSKLKDFTDALDSMRSDVKQYFEMTVIDAKGRIRDLQMDLEEFATNTGELEIKRDDRQNTHTTGILFWQKTHYTTETVYSASTNEALKKFQNIAMGLKRIIHDEWRNFFDL